MDVDSIHFTSHLSNLCRFFAGKGVTVVLNFSHKVDETFRSPVKYLDVCDTGSWLCAGPEFSAALLAGHAAPHVARAGLVYRGQHRGRV